MFSSTWRAISSSRKNRREEFHAELLCSDENGNPAQYTGCRASGPGLIQTQLGKPLLDFDASTVRDRFHSSLRIRHTWHWHGFVWLSRVNVLILRGSHVEWSLPLDVSQLTFLSHCMALTQNDLCIIRLTHIMVFELQDTHNMPVKFYDSRIKRFSRYEAPIWHLITWVLRSTISK
jgi:hypothetical protein